VVVPALWILRYGRTPSSRPHVRHVERQVLAPLTVEVATQDHGPRAQTEAPVPDSDVIPIRHATATDMTALDKPPQPTSNNLGRLL
jgi:hypothetical protein